MGAGTRELYKTSGKMSPELLGCATLHTNSNCPGSYASRRDEARQGEARQGRAGQGWAGQGWAGQGRAGQDRAGQGRAGQGKERERCNSSLVSCHVCAGELRTSVRRYQTLPTATEAIKMSAARKPITRSKLGEKTVQLPRSSDN